MSQYTTNNLNYCNYCGNPYNYKIIIITNEYAQWLCPSRTDSNEIHNQLTETQCPFCNEISGDLIDIKNYLLFNFKNLSLDEKFLKYKQIIRNINIIKLHNFKCNRIKLKKEKKKWNQEKVINLKREINNLENKVMKYKEKLKEYD